MRFESPFFWRDDRRCRPRLDRLGNLSIAVTGNGEVCIAESLLEHLEVGVTGEGTGRIFLAEAERQPVINRIGAGEIVIGKAR